MVASSVTFGLSLNELSTKAFYESIHEKKKIIGRFATKNVAAYQTDYIIEKLVSLQTRPNTFFSSSKSITRHSMDSRGLVVGEDTVSS